MRANDVTFLGFFFLRTRTRMQENTQLRTLLKQYLDGISVNDEILSQVNPLFIVNQRTNVQ